MQMRATLHRYCVCVCTRRECVCDSVCGEKREKEPTSFSGLYFLSFQRCGIAGTLLYNILSISLAHTSTRTSTLAHFKGVKLPLKHKHVHIKIDTLCAVAFPMHTSLERKDGMRAFARTLSLSLSLRKQFSQAFILVGFQPRARAPIHPCWYGKN